MIRKSKRTILAVLAATFTMAALAGCNGETVIVQPGGGGGGGYVPPIGGGGSGGGYIPPIDPYYTAWYDVYGTYCGNDTPMPGCNFYSDGYKIVDYEDPYYYNKYLQYSSAWTYTDSYGYRQYYSGYAWLSGTGILYDEWGRALNEVEQAQGNDLLGAAAELETQAIDTSGKSLAGRFALAEDRGIEIARTLNDWAVLGKSRSRTGRDVANFSERLYGVNLDNARQALADAAQGNLKNLDQLNRQIASYWGTNPETSQAILSGWYAGQYQVK